MSKDQKDALKRDASDDLKMVNRYIDGAGMVRVPGTHEGMMGSSCSMYYMLISSLQCYKVL